MKNIEIILQNYKLKKDESYANDILSVLKSSKEFEQFYKSFNDFLSQWNIDVVKEPDFQEIFVIIHKQLETNLENIWKVCEYLTRQIKKLNTLDISYDEKLNKFICTVVWEENIPLINDYMQNNWEVVNSTFRAKRYKFLKNVENSLVKPVIIGWMWAMGIINYLGSDYINNLPAWSANAIQAFVTLAILVGLKQFAKYKSNK